MSKSSYAGWVGGGVGGGVHRDYSLEFFSWVIINPVQGPLAVPGPDYKVQGCFFIRTSDVCASRSGAAATGRRPPALTAPTCAQLSAIDGETQQRVIVGFQTLAAACCFCSVCRTVSTLLFSCAGVKTIGWLPESCDCIEMESGGRRVSE